MGYSDPHEGDRPGKGRHAGGEQAGKENQLQAKAPHIHPQALGIALPHLVGADGLGQQEGQRQQNRHQRSHIPHIGPGGAGKGALGPVMQVHNVGIISKGNGKVRNGGADIAHHHAAHHQHGHVPHPAGEQQNKAHGQQRPNKSSQHQNR